MDFKKHYRQKNSEIAVYLVDHPPAFYRFLDDPGKVRKIATNCWICIDKRATN